MFKKFFLVSLTTLYLFVLSLSSWVPKVHAQEPGPWYNQSYDEWYSKVYGNATPPNEIFGERYTAAQVQWVIYGLKANLENQFLSKDMVSCRAGGDLTSCAQAVFDFFDKIPPIATINNTQNIGARSDLNNNPIKLVISDVLTQKPASFVYYLNTVGQRLHIVPEANAQTGFGFQTLNPVLLLWKYTRNFTYSFFVIITLAAAFMIMFRVKISPQTIITVQSALPKIIVTLILITFSYAIAGLMIDLMYVVIGLIASFFSQSGGLGNFNFTYGIMTRGAILDLGILGNMALYVGLFFWGLLFATAGMSSFGITSVLALSLFIFLITFIVGLLLIWWAIKIIWLLFKTIGAVFLQIIFAPIQIGIGAITPAAGFGSWLKSLVANLAVFPIVGTLFLISFYFAEIGMLRGLAYTLNNADWVTKIAKVIFEKLSGIPIPDIVSTGPWPLVGSHNADALIFLGVSFGIIAIIPKTAELIQSFIQGKPFAYGTAIGEAVGPVGMAGKGGLQYGVQRYETERMKVFSTQFPGQKYSGEWWANALRGFGIIK